MGFFLGGGVISMIMLIFNGFSVCGSSFDVKITSGIASNNFCNLHMQGITLKFWKDDFSKELGKLKQFIT